MPKTEIDYSNTIIYKITCKNPTITDVYVGHTTNFVQRKHAHKQNCKNNKSANHKCKLYAVICANGGWENWQMEIINFFNCADHYAARKKEQEYFIELNANLNSIEPFPKPKVETENKIVKETKIYANSAEEYSCELCSTTCSKKNDWDRHIKTNKHLRNAGKNVETKKPAPDFTCKCSKSFKTNSGLWKHNKVCEYKVCESKPKLAQYIKEDPNPIHDMAFLTNLVIEVVKNNTELVKQNQEYQKQNQDLQKQMLEVCKNGMGGSHNQNHTNSHNKTFNMQVFLNEKCKDAMNIMDFVNTMTLDFADLEEVGKVGYVEGIGGIIIKKLNDMDIYKRPIHCSDAKREIMYVKDENVWEKENSTYDKLRKAIKHVTCKNSSMLEPWSKAHPQCMNTSHRLNDVYVQMIGQAMGGKESFLESENKIMKKIAKAVLIDKALLN